MSRGARGAALAALLGAAGCCTCAAPPTLTVREGPALHPPAPPPLAPPSLRVLHFADSGDATCQQRAVVAGMATAHRRAPFDLGLAVGDVIYQCGPDAALRGAEACTFAPGGNEVAPGFVPPPDRSFAVHDGPLAFLGRAPVYVALGNHDVASGFFCGGGGARAAREKACLAVAHVSPQWAMPGRHYVVDRGRARFIVVDTNLVASDYGGFSLDDEVAFVAAQAAGCAGRACFLVGHHPAATAGEHRDDFSPAFAARMQRLVDAGQGRLRAVLAGHDHDLIHLRAPGGLDVLVSGAASRGRLRESFEPTAGATLLFASRRWGFGVLEIGEDGWRYRFLDDGARALYCCTAVGDGRCDPTTCP